MQFNKPLPRSFYDRPTEIVAQELLGKVVVSEIHGSLQLARIVEVEAYLGPHDLASHSSKGLTPRTKTMFGPPGYAYVYLIYGMYHCLNFVTERAGHPAAVLIRALEPLHEIAARTQGPGLLCKALGIDKSLNGHDLLQRPFFVSADLPSDKFRIVKRPRIGVAYARHWAKRLLRFYIAGNAYVSKP